MLPAVYPLKQFVQDLVDLGQVRVSRVADFSEGDRRAAVEIFHHLDARRRDELPGDAPELSMPSALWAAALLYRGCQAFIYRDMGAELIEEALALPCPEAVDASVIYSVDLTLRYLPDLRTMARGFSPEDPLVKALDTLAARWPLSSVGLAVKLEANLDDILDHPCLRRVYVDRVLARTDHARAKDPRVRRGILEAVGDHRDLARGLVEKEEEAWTS